MSNVSEQMQPSCRDKVSGWWLAGPASDFVVGDVCCIWNTQDMTEAPLVKSIDLSTGSGCHTPRVCTIEEYREYVHIVKSDLGVQTNGGTPNVTMQFCIRHQNDENATTAPGGECPFCLPAHGCRTDMPVV